MHQADQVGQVDQQHQVVAATLFLSRLEAEDPEAPAVQGALRARRPTRKAWQSY